MEAIAPADAVKAQVMMTLHDQVYSMTWAARSESGHLLRAWNTSRDQGQPTETKTGERDCLLYTPLVESYQG